MTSKRRAEKELNHLNYNVEDEPEEAGVFLTANQDVLKERRVLKAKRKAPDADSENGQGAFKGAFKGFSGFGSTNLGSSKIGFSFGNDTTLSNGKKELSDHKAETAEVKSFSSIDDKLKSTSASKSTYLQQLKALNEGVAKWIKDHVDKNACCILTPIFQDYEKHLAEIEKYNVKDDSAAEKEEKTIINETKAETDIAKSNYFSKDNTAKDTATGSSLFSFSTGNTKSVFGSSTSTTSVFGGSSGGGFSFASSESSSKTFSFATGGAQGKTEEQTEEEYVPPKEEVKEIKEDDAFYTKRCKLFYQKDGTWVEKGVGNLHMKPCKDKVQLLIRADTNLGNILLNIMLSSQMPFARQGKNNVSMICIPNPPMDPKMDASKPVSMLLRVKTGEDADELLNKLNESKS